MSRRRWIATGITLAGAVMTAAIAVLTGVGPAWAVRWGDSTAGGAIIFLPVAVAFGLGVFPPRLLGLAVALGMTALLQVGGVNPLFLFAPMGTWGVGYIVGDRLRLVDELRRAGDQLRADSERLAEESVRYERARIARELHDIVAHCVSVTVVQAYAGERLLTDDPESARAAFDHIAEAASQARSEIRRLVDLLDEETLPREASLDASLGGLVAGAQAAGLDVRLRGAGDLQEVPAAVSLVAHRVVREALTNALKHAPGSAVEVTVDCGARQLRVTVTDAGAAGPAMPVPLGGLGGGRGIVGMRSRVADLGGALTAGRTPPGGWQVTAELPLEVPSAIPRVEPGVVRPATVSEEVG